MTGKEYWTEPKIKSSNKSPFTKLTMGFRKDKDKESFLTF